MNDLESLRAYINDRPGVTESFPFDNDTLVFKAGGKMFALIPIEREPLSVTLKCDPDRAQDLRAKYDDITGAYHMNKKHWNSIALTGRVPLAEVRALIEHSYELVVAGLPKKQQEALGLS